MAVKYVDGLEVVSLAFLQHALKGYRNLQVLDGVHSGFWLSSASTHLTENFITNLD